MNKLLYINQMLCLKKHISKMIKMSRLPEKTDPEFFILRK